MKYMLGKGNAHIELGVFNDKKYIGLRRKYLVTYDNKTIEKYKMINISVEEFKDIIAHWSKLKGDIERLFDISLNK